MRWAVALGSLAVVAGALVLGLSGSGEEDFTELPPPPGFTDTPPPEEQARTQEEPSTARELFGHACSACHTLRAAGSRAALGVDLDRVRPSVRRVREAIRNGAGSGAMPAGLLTGRDADRVARYVARFAGSG